VNLGPGLLSISPHNKINFLLWNVDFSVYLLLLNMASDCLVFIFVFLFLLFLMFFHMSMVFLLLGLFFKWWCVFFVVVVVLIILFPIVFVL
jgi:hypothetical protein